MRLEAPEPRQPRKLPGDLLGEHPDPAGGARDGAGHRTRQAPADPGGELEPDAEAGADAGRLDPGRVVGEHADPGRQLAARPTPARPGGDGGPGRLGRGRADDETEVAGAQRELVDVGAGGGADDRPHPGRRSDLVDLADHDQHRTVDVGEGHRAVLDHEAALEHPVVGDELAHEVGDRRARPGNPPLAHQKAPLALARQQRLAVVKLAHEVEPLAQRP